jgi:23S rRNA (uracil1939-C5)-methyltransferase
VIEGTKLYEFRVRARLAIRGRLNSPKLGLFRAGTHRVVHIPNCSVHHRLINRVAGVVRRALVECRVTSYSERAHVGFARYLQVVVERASQRAQVVIVGNGPDLNPFEACFEAICAGLGAELHSLWFNANETPGNTILGTRFQRWCGPESVVERFGESAVFFPPGAFGQSNVEIAGAIIEHIRARIAPGSRVVEFYAGVGAIGLSVLSRVDRIVLNEIAPHSLQGLDSGIAALDEGNARKIEVVRGPAGAACSAAGGADLVIVDPPRKGLDAALLDYLIEHPPGRIAYVSCGMDALLRDAARLTAGGALRLVELTAFNLLPFTEHVETVAWFERR